MTAVDAAAVARAVAEVREVIAGRTDRPVSLVAVTKGFGFDAVAAALAAGADGVGENYAQELLAKDVSSQGRLSGPLPWHFIGRLQRNKVRHLAALVRCWQSVDRLELGTEIARRAPGASVLVEVNLTEDPAKGGCAAGAAPGLVAALRDLDLDVRGLMTIGVVGDEAATRRAFARLSGLADVLSLPERSMGMSDDFALAVEEGATIVRVGRRLFGPRPLRS